jgi:hypothetical protein
MAWGYRLELMGARDGARCREDGRSCAVGKCEGFPMYLSAYRYTRSTARAVTVTRPLCVKHARRFSMTYSLAWPDMLRRARRQLAVTWAQLAA